MTDNDYLEAGEHQLDRNPEEQSLAEILSDSGGVDQPIGFDADPNYDHSGDPDYTVDDATGEINYHEDLILGSNPTEIAEDLGVDTVE